MNNTELIAQVRLNTTIEDGALDYPEAVMLSEMNDALTTKFQQGIIDANQGYWVKNFVTTTVSGQSSVRIPARSVGLSKVQIGTGSPASYIRFHQVFEANADLYDSPLNTIGPPQAYVARSDQIVLMPPADGPYSIRIFYYLRPSKLRTPQLGLAGGQAERGRVTAINTSTRVITVNLVPFDMSLAVPAVITSGVQQIDVVHPDGWHELALVGATQTFSGLNITVGGTDPLTDIQIGDYVRVADQTDWPPLPDDYHRCLADVTSVKILTQQSNPQKGAQFGQDVSADLGRFGKLIAARVTEEPRTVRADLPGLRRYWRG